MVMSYKKTVFVALCLFTSLLFFSCASVDKKEPAAVEPELPQLFLDWQYKGFSDEYPCWCEVILLEKDINELIQFFPQIKGREASLEVLMNYAEDVDSCSHFLAEEDFTEEQAELLAKTWVLTDPYYEEFDYPYISIKLYLKNPQEESL